MRTGGRWILSPESGVKLLISTAACETSLLDRNKALNNSLAVSNRADLLFLKTGYDPLVKGGPLPGGKKISVLVEFIEVLQENIRWIAISIRRTERPDQNRIEENLQRLLCFVQTARITLILKHKHINLPGVQGNAKTPCAVIRLAARGVPRTLNPPLIRIGCGVTMVRSLLNALALRTKTAALTLVDAM